jgi:hypothetical protein
MIGYDDMDMIVEILENRSSIVAEVSPTLGSARKPSIDTLTSWRRLSRRLPIVTRQPSTDMALPVLSLYFVQTLPDGLVHFLR